MTIRSLKQYPCKFKPCGKMFTKYKSTDKHCSRPCYLADFAQKELNKNIAEMKMNVIKLSTLKSLAKKQVQKWVRLRDKDLPCISCGTNYTQQWDGGHYLKAEIYSGVIFHTKNINKQCCNCNDHLQGNIIEYRKGMIKKYGEATVLELEELGNKIRKYTWTREELISITETYKLKIKNGDFTDQAA